MRLIGKEIKKEDRAEVNSHEEGCMWTPLHFACLNGNVALITAFLYREAAIEARTSSLITPLMVACQKGFEQVAFLLINAGAELNSQDRNGNTPLHYAAQAGYTHVVELLLKHPSLKL